MTDESINNRGRSKFWMWTQNNPTLSSDEVKTLFEGHVNYMVFQKERGENGTEHFQGYVDFTTRKRLSACRAFLACHWERRRGTATQAREYCMKEDTRVEGPWEIGSFRAVRPGQRTDLDLFTKAIREGDTTKALIDKGFCKEMARYPKYYATVKSTMRMPRRVGLEVELLYGETGLGKTRYAYDNYEEDMYATGVDNGTLWFDGYDSHKVVLFDDFAGAASRMTLTNLLRILDIYPINVPVKGSYVPFEAERILITTNLHPFNWYDYESRMSQYRALARRITNVRYFKMNSENETEIEIPDHDEFFHNHVHRY